MTKISNEGRSRL